MGTETYLYTLAAYVKIAKLQEAKILIGADLEKIFDDADFVCMNLEVSLTDKISPIKKCGSNLIASTKIVVDLKKINPYFFMLVNNHIMRGFRNCSTYALH